MLVRLSLSRAVEIAQIKFRVLAIYVARKLSHYTCRNNRYIAAATAQTTWPDNEVPTQSSHFGWKGVGGLIT